MPLDLSPGAVVNAASSVPLLALGLWVARARPRTRATMALAAYSLAFGLIWIPNNLVTYDDPLWAYAPFLALHLGSMLASAGALVLLGLWFPAPLQAGQRRWLLPAVLALAAPPVTVLAELAQPAGPLRALVAANPALGAIALPMSVVMGASFFSLVVVALRFRASAGPGERRSLALMGASVVLFPAVFAGDSFQEPAQNPFALTMLVLLVALAGLWLRNAARAAGTEARLARNVALLGVAAFLAAMLVQRTWGGAFTTAGGPHFGLARMLGVLILAWAILRHGMLGVDVKAKWTIRQSTLAAAFVGVFFVVSEGAQELFSGAAGPLLGIGAAGLLVFALAPLQRAAERVASAAVPGVGARDPMTGEERRRAFAAACGLLWHDGQLTLKERRALDGLRAQLGLGDEEALRIEREVTEALHAAGPAREARAARR